MFSKAKIVCLLLVFIVGVCKSEDLVVPHNETEPINGGNVCNDFVNDNIIELLEGFRVRMNQSWPLFGIPPLDPHVVEEISLDGSLSPLLEGLLIQMTSITIVGLNQFQANDLDFNILGFGIGVQLVIPRLTLSGRHVSSGSLLGLIPVQGQGGFNISIHNLTIDLAGQLNHTGPGWDVPIMRVNVTIDAITGGFDGLSDTFLNELLNVSGPEVLELIFPEFQPVLEDLIKEIFVGFLNEFLLGDLIGVLFGAGFDWPDPILIPT